MFGTHGLLGLVILMILSAAGVLAEDFRYCHGGPQGTCFGFNLASRTSTCYALLLEVGPVDTVIGIAKGIQYTLFTGGGCTGSPSPPFAIGVNSLSPPFLNNVFSVSIQLTESSWQSLGCYTDSGPRTLAGTRQTTSTQTIEKCQDYCASSGYKYAGVEYETECWCDYAIRAPGALASEPGTCNMRCGGNASQICGGPNRINIYFNDNGVPGPSNPATIGNGAFAYRGCYTDRTDARTLQNRYDIPISAGGVKPETCAATCKMHGYTIVGLEFGRECWCGNTLASGAAKVTEDDCRTTCPADPAFYCGHANRLNIWSSGAL